MQLVPLYFRTAALGSLLLAASSCQTAQKPAALLPPAAAPVLKPADSFAQTPASSNPQVVAQTEQTPAQKPAPPEAVVPAPAPPASDPVADLIARVEKEYLSALWDDLEIWRYQDYIEHPAMAKRDARPYTALRRWARQFYEAEDTAS